MRLGKWGVIGGLVLAFLVGAAALVSAAETLDLVFLVDESGSLCYSGPTPQPPGNVAVEVDGFISALNEVIAPWVSAGGTARIAVVSFGRTVIQRIGLTDVATNKAAIVAALNAIKSSPTCGSTNLGGAVNLARVLLDDAPADSKRVINLATNGAATTGPSFQNACTDARDAGYEIWAIGIGDADAAALQSCTANPARYFYVATVAEFASAEETKLAAIAPTPPPPGPGPGPGPGPTPTPTDGNGITVDYKGTLLDAVADLLDLTNDLLNEARKSLFESLVKVKDWKVEAQATLETCLKYQPAEGYLPCAGKAAFLVGSADKEKQTTFKGLTTVHESLQDLQAEVTDLIMEIEQASLDEEIGQTIADALTKKTVKDEKGNDRPYAPLLVLMVLLSEKNIYLVEMDKLLEQANEYESEALAWLTTAMTTCGNNLDCQKKAIKEALGPLKSSIKLIRQVEKYVWAIKDNIKTIKAWLCGFQQLVIRAPLILPGEGERAFICPWCLPPLVAAAAELRTFSQPGVIRFAAFGGAVQGMRVRVFNLSGRAVFDSGMVAGNMLSWRTYGVANGVYLYIIEATTAAGTTQSEVRKVAVVR
ncbi:MAG: VWA domain-containing protein [Candidatus Acetothermia bacterium]|jgi:hypothetical protein|nr:VWA domain-containing protein [Candidatus Acetothermia bacterium]MDH7505590.1 VWA domain-containing protein [Candidatus Acetothermia bacterium]